MFSTLLNVFSHYFVLLRVLVYQNHLRPNGKQFAAAAVDWHPAIQTILACCFSITLSLYSHNMKAASPSVQWSVSPDDTWGCTAVFIPLMRSWYTYICLSGWSRWYGHKSGLKRETEGVNEREGGQGKRCKEEEMELTWLSLFSPQWRAERGQGCCPHPGQGLSAWDSIPLISPPLQSGREQVSNQLLAHLKWTQTLQRHALTVQYTQEILFNAKEWCTAVTLGVCAGQIPYVITSQSKPKNSFTPNFFFVDIYFSKHAFSPSITIHNYDNT